MSRVSRKVSRSTIRNGMSSLSAIAITPALALLLTISATLAFPLFLKCSMIALAFVPVPDAKMISDCISCNKV